MTQVALGRPELVLHNRLTHSLKVEQVGSAIYSRLRLLAGENDDVNADPQAIAAACLAHDLGHPPFGHAAEQKLNELLTCPDHRRNARPYKVRKESPCEGCDLEDGFEGNAQSFRILTRLASHRSNGGHGLDLTRQTLAAVTKYPWLRGENDEKPGKWGAYDCDVDALSFALQRDVTTKMSSGELLQTLDAAIMDWADDISYAVHDIEDFYRSGLIPLSDYHFDPRSDTLERFLTYVRAQPQFAHMDEDSPLYQAMRNMWTLLPTSIYNGTKENHLELDRARSYLLTEFINAVSIVDGQLTRETGQEELNSLIKQLIWFHVIDGPRLSNIQLGQQRVVQDLYQILKPLAIAAYDVDDTNPDKMKDEQLIRRLPYNLTVFVKEAIAHPGATYQRDKAILRGLVDFIASLSDEDAYFHHSVLTGASTHASL